MPLRYLTVKWLRRIDGPISRMNVKYPVKVSMTIQRKPKYDKERKKYCQNDRKWKRAYVSQKVDIAFRLCYIIKVIFENTYI